MFVSLETNNFKKAKEITIAIHIHYENVITCSPFYPPFKKSDEFIKASQDIFYPCNVHAMFKIRLLQADLDNSEIICKTITTKVMEVGV